MSERADLMQELVKAEAALRQSRDAMDSSTFTGRLRTEAALSRYRAAKQSYESGGGDAR